MIVERETTWSSGGTSVELHEGATKITLQEILDWVIKCGLDPAGVYVTPEMTCYGEGQDHDKHIELFWTLNNMHPANT